MGLLGVLKKLYSTLIQTTKIINYLIDIIVQYFIYIYFIARLLWLNNTHFIQIIEFILSKDAFSPNLFNILIIINIDYVLIIKKYIKNNIHTKIPQYKNLWFTRKNVCTYDHTSKFFYYWKIQIQVHKC